MSSFMHHVDESSITYIDLRTVDGVLFIGFGASVTDKEIYLKQRIDVVESLYLVDVHGEIWSYSCTLWMSYI